MKGKFVKLASVAVVGAGISGTALAEGNLLATLDEDVNRLIGAEGTTACHDADAVAPAALQVEAPWVSLALMNAERIGLSDEQIRKLERLRAEFERTAASQSRTIANAERSLQQLLIAQPVDLQRVGTRLDEIAALRSTLRLRRIETLLVGRDLLSTGQQERLQELAAKAATAMHRAMMESIEARREPATPGESM